MSGTPLSTLDARDLVGQRVLAVVKTSLYETRRELVEEYRVLEVSPKGLWVKLMTVHGKKFWQALTVVMLVEVLTPLEAKPAS